MKNFKYKVLFNSRQSEIVYALSPERAKILAQAEQIKKGNSYEIKNLIYLREKGVSNLTNK